jgi:hypothetical protein
LCPKESVERDDHAGSNSKPACARFDAQRPIGAVVFDLLSVCPYSLLGSLSADESAERLRDGIYPITPHQFSEVITEAVRVRYKLRICFLVPAFSEVLIEVGRVCHARYSWCSGNHCNHAVDNAVKSERQRILALIEPCG